jgi:hypothetical protein
MGCKTRRSKHLFKNKKSLRYRNKKGRTLRGGSAPNHSADVIARTPFEESGNLPGQKDNNVMANTIMSNISKASSIGLQVANNSVNGFLDGIASKLNIDSSKPALNVASEGAVKLGKIASVMGTPEGDKLKEKFSNVLVELVDTTKPALDEVTKVGEEFLDKSGTAAVNAGLNMVGAVPGVGTTVELIRVLNNAGQAFNAGVDAAADLTKVSSEAAIKIHAITDEAGNLVQEANILAEGANTDNPENAHIPAASAAPAAPEAPPLLFSNPNSVTNPNGKLPDAAPPAAPPAAQPAAPPLPFLVPNNVTNPNGKLLHTAEGAKTDINREPHTYSSMRMNAEQAAGGMRTLSQLQKAGKRIENRVESSLKEFHKNTKTRKKVRFNL